MANIYEQIAAATAARVDNGAPLRGGSRPGEVATPHPSRASYDELLALMAARGEKPYAPAASEVAINQNMPGDTGNPFAQPMWDRVPGIESQPWYIPASGSGDTEQAMRIRDYPAAVDWLNSQGMSWQVGSDGPRQMTGAWVTGPDGQPMLDTGSFHSGGDERFKWAALLAGGITGANVLGAGFGVAGAPTAGAGGAGAAPVAGGAQAFPVSPGGPMTTTQLGPLAGGPPMAAGTAGAGGAGAITGPGLAAPAGAMAPATSLGSTGLGTAAATAPTAGGPGGFDWGSLFSGQGLRSGIDILSGLYGMKLAGDARELSDPFAQYRPGYGQALANLEANPGSITQRPGWLAGTELIKRQMGARGYTGSGNEKAALSRYAGDFYTQEANRLATLAGAGQTPGAGQFSSAQLASQSLGSIGYGIAPWLPNRP